MNKHTFKKNRIDFCLSKSAKLQVLLFVLLLGATALRLHAQTFQPPVAVPAESAIDTGAANLSLKKDLDQRRLALQQRFDKWNVRAVAFNAHYGGRDFKDGSAEAATGLAEQSRLSKLLNSYLKDANKFKMDVARLRLKTINPASSPAVATTAGDAGQPAAKTVAEPQMVDARNVPSGLPKSVDDAIAAGYAGAATGVSDRVRKGFQAVATHDWNLAKAWFGDALNHDPDNAGLKRLVELSDYTGKRVQQGSPGKSTNPSASRTSIVLPSDSDILFLFPGWKPVQAAEPSTTGNTSSMLPEEWNPYFFPGLPAIEARIMNDYMFDQIIEMTEHDPVLIKLSNRPVSNSPKIPPTYKK